MTQFIHRCTRNAIALVEAIGEDYMTIGLYFEPILMRFNWILFFF